MPLKKETKPNQIDFICLRAQILLKSHHQSLGGARGVMVIVTGYGHGDTSSIPGQDWLHFA